MAKNRYDKMTLEQAEEELKENRLLYSKALEEKDYEEEKRLTREQMFLLRRLDKYTEDPCPLDTKRIHMNCELCTGYIKNKVYIFNTRRKTHTMCKKDDTKGFPCHLKKKWKGII